jgi:hypothetical protein
MTRAIVTACIAFTAPLACGFAWPPDYVEQSRADVAICVAYARQTSPRFDARVESVDLETGRVEIQRVPGDARGELAFSKCLLSVRRWRFIDRNLPKPIDRGPLDLTRMAGLPR